MTDGPLALLGGTLRPTGSRSVFIALILIGLWLRLVYAALVPNEVPRWRDGIEYENIAQNLLEGRGYRDTSPPWPGEPPYGDPQRPTAFRLPGYPFFIALLYSIAGKSPRAIFVAQALMFLPLSVIIGAAAMSLGGVRAALWTVILVAFDPFSIFLCGTVQSEPLFTFLFSIGVLVVLRDFNNAARTRAVVLFGAFMGFATLTRTIALPVFVSIILVGFLVEINRGRPFRDEVTRAIMSVAVFIAVISPWLLRNKKVTGRLTLSTGTWLAIAVGNNDEAAVSLTQKSLAAMPITTRQQTEIERELIYKRFATKWIVAHPLGFVWNVTRRAIMFWGPAPSSAGGVRAGVGTLFSVVVYVGAALGLWRGRAVFRLRWVFVTVFVAFTFLHAVTSAATRYRLPLYPVMELLAGFGFSPLVFGGRDRQLAPTNRIARMRGAVLLYVHNVRSVRALGAGGRPRGARR